MNFFIKYLKETIEGINLLIEQNISFVNIKILRHILDVESSNRSKINFYWRNLQLLEKKKIIEIVPNHPSNKLYKLPNSRIDIDDFIGKLEIYN